MCGIGIVVETHRRPVPYLEAALNGMNELLAHRGPDGEGAWIHPHGHLGFAHRRLKIIGLDRGEQPMSDGNGNWITYNGEIYNYVELREQLGRDNFTTDSDTEVILRAYRRWGRGCFERLRGMFALALWDEEQQVLVLARDRFGIKPLYYAVVGDVLYCASEIKALLPFVPSIETDREALKDYLAFQFTLGGKTLFRGISELPPGHFLLVRGSVLRLERYWEVQYDSDLDHTERYFASRLRELLEDSVAYHLRADVPVGAYLSGGLDSSVIAALAARRLETPLAAFSGRFAEGPQYDESSYARLLAEQEAIELHEIEIRPDDFRESIASMVYYLDYPVAGPGSFPQYVVSRTAAGHRKVVLGGQGADEIFGGYARYLLAYFEQCIKAAIEGTTHRAPFVVTYESIIPNLRTLYEYKPLMQEFWREGLFGDLDERYFRLINRAPALGDAIDWPALGDYSPLESFLEIFRADNVGRDSYFDRMTHFDFKTLLPALLHVEDRVSMAHGLESRVPFIDHRIVEFAATLPAIVKFKDGELKYLLRSAVRDVLPKPIFERQDKMGFPVPLDSWLRGPLREFFFETLAGTPTQRWYLGRAFDPDAVIRREGAFGRGLWGLFSLELWHQQFHDRSDSWRELGRRFTTAASPARGVAAATGR